jgi:hypothetical protein
MNILLRLALRVAEAVAYPVTCTRPPDFIVGDKEHPYLLRWFITGAKPDGKPRMKWGLFRAYVHCFLRSDDDRAHHDHPAWSISIGLSGRAFEETIVKGGIHRRRELKAGTIRIRSAKFAHRIEILPDEQYWTLFIFFRNIRDWGFHCPNGWVPWWEFTAPDDKGAIGRGCGEPS